MQLLILFSVGFIMLGAGSPSASFDRVGHQLVCQCGCGEILLECNHVGCPVSGPMIEELKAQIATGLPANGVLNWFSQKYGPIVLAAPIRGGFDTVAWIVPFAVLILGIGAVVFLMRSWRSRRVPQPAAAEDGYTPAVDSDMRERIRRNTEFEA